MQFRSLPERLRTQAKRLKSNLMTLYVCCRDPRVLWYAKALAAVVVAYAFSPIDLIPDFIPVLGYLDDLVLVPLGIYAALKLIPESVLADNRTKAQQIAQRPNNLVMAVLIAAIWLAAAWWLGRFIYNRLK